MQLPIRDRLENLNDFVIANEVLKGVDEEFGDNFRIGEIILNTLKSKPDHVAQIDAETGKQTTFAEMQEFSVRCGLWLRKQGIGPDDIVTLCTHNHLDSYAPFFATFYTAAINNAWHFEITLNPARHLMKLFQPKVIFACESVVKVLLEAARLENVRTRIIVFGSYPNLESLRDITQGHTNEEVQSFRPREIKGQDDIGLILLSSGSSGLPKGVMHSYKSITYVIQSFMPLIMNDVALWYSTNYWITGFSFTLQNFLSFGTRIIHSSSNVEDICRVIEKYKVKRFFITPTTLTQFLKLKVLEKYKLPSLEVIITGGTTVNPQMSLEFRKFLSHVLIVQSYGMSETAHYLASQTRNYKSPNSVGVVGSNTRIKIVDLESGKTLGPNKAGEIWVLTKVLMSGYYKNAELTRETIDEEGWLHTGDKAYYNESGEIFIVDRVKEVMKYQNHQVSPTEIEEVLLSHPDVIECSVVPIPHIIDGDRAMAFVVKAPNSKVTEKELVNLSATLGEIKKLWGGVKFLDRLPKTPSNKILRPRLKEMAKELAGIKKED